jgi:hypothetical protein
VHSTYVGTFAWHVVLACTLKVVHTVCVCRICFWQKVSDKPLTFQSRFNAKERCGCA